MSLGVAVVLTMVVGLGTYLLFHSPLAAHIDGALGTRLACVWRCTPFEPIADTVAAMLAIAAAFLGAWGVTVRLAMHGLERLVAGGILVYAFVAVPAAAIAGMGDLAGGHLLAPPIGPLLVAVPGGIAFAAGLRGRRWDGHGLALSIRIRRPTPLAAVLAGVVCMLITVSAGTAVTHPPTGYDELGYHLPLAILLWRTGSLVVPLELIPRTFAMAQPGSTELWFGLLHQVGGEALMVLGQLPFAVLGAAAIALFGRRAGLPARAATIGGLAFLAAPMVVIGIGRDANDVAAAAMVAAIAALLMAPESGWAPGRIALIGLGLGLLAVTKLALLPSVAALGVVLLWVVLRPRSGVPRTVAWRGLAAAVALAALAVAPWWVRDLHLFGNPIYPAMLPVLGRGVAQPRMGMMDRLHVPAAWMWPVYPWVSPNGAYSGLGALFAVMVIPGVVLAIRRARRRSLAIVAVVGLVSLLAWWTQTRHEPRFLLGPLALVFALLPFAIVGLRRRWMTLVAVLLMVTAVASGVLTLVAGMDGLMSDPVDRTAFYHHVAGSDRAVLALPTHAGLLVDDDCVDHAFDRLYPMLGTDQSRPLARVSCGASTAEVLRTMSRYHLRYVFVLQPLTNTAAVDARYPSDRFTLVSDRRITRRGHLGGTLHRIYELDAPPLTLSPSPRPTLSPMPVPSAAATGEASRVVVAASPDGPPAP